MVEPKKKVDETWKREVEEEKRKAEAASESPRGERAGATQEDLSEAPPLEASFPLFITSLATQALVQMGQIESPITGKKEKNLQEARYTIDILGIIEEKTKGNLENDEARLLRSVLYDLRMHYVEAAKDEKS